MKKFFVILSAMALLIPTSAVASGEGNTSINEEVRLISTNQEVSLKERYDFLLEKGILKGRKDGKVQFNASLTRTELAMSLYRLFKLESQSGIKNDAKSYQARKALLTVYDKRGKFKPNKRMTIEEVAEVLAKSTNLETEKYASIELTASNWAKGYLAAALAEGFLKSEDDYRDIALRSHLVYSLYEVYQYIHQERGIVAGTLEPKVTVSNTKDQDYKWTFTVKNQTEKEQTVNLSASKFDYILKKDGKKVEQYTDNKKFIMIYIEKILKQGEELSFEGELLGLAKGKYELEIWLIDRNWPDAKTKIEFEVK